MRTCAGTQQKRRSTRVRAQIPVRVTSLDPARTFSESCHTLVVNPQGCGIRFPRPLEPGLHIRMDDLPGGGSAAARVANSLPLPTSDKYWLIGISLESPGNCWCIAPTPQDWGAYSTLPRFFPSSIKDFGENLFGTQPVARQR